MHGLESDTIGGLNAVLEKNRKLEGSVVVSIVLFNEHANVLHDRIPIEEVNPLTRNDYQPGGCTALLDAVGHSIRHISRVQRYMPSEYKAEKMIFVITTDGLENASREFTYPKVKDLISRHSEQGWEFLFLGANIDVAAEAGRLGIAEDRATGYQADLEGTQAMYDSVADACCSMRSSKARIGRSWTAAIDKDAKRRG